MKKSFYATLPILLLAFAEASASQVDFLFSGPVTFSRDDAGWFLGAFPENSIFNGRIRYDTSLAAGDVSNPNDPSFAQYQFHPNPITPPAMALTDLHGHAFSSATEFFVNTYDNYGLNPPVPGIVPFDELFYTTYGNFNFDGGGLTMEHYYAEFSIHFNSSTLSSTTSDALPSAPPDLSKFADSYFNIYVFASGINAPIAYYHGTVSSVTPVPEPATVTLFLSGVCLWLLKRKNQSARASVMQPFPG